MELPAFTRERIAEIRAIHVIEKKSFRVGLRWRWLDWCKYCCQVGCRQLQWADDVEAGRRAPAGWFAGGPAVILMLAVMILLAVGATVVLSVRAPACDHTVYPNIHPGSARIFYACRCGERFER